MTIITIISVVVGVVAYRMGKKHGERERLERRVDDHLAGGGDGNNNQMNMMVPYNIDGVGGGHHRHATANDIRGLHDHMDRIFEIIRRGNDGRPGPVPEENVVAAEAAEEVGVDAAAAVPPPPVAPPPANVVVFPP